MGKTWDYLDRMDNNLLYKYSSILANNGKKQIHTKSNLIYNQQGDVREQEIAKLRLARTNKRRAYYLIWFVYRYVLGCETYEEAKPYMNKETLAFFQLTSYIYNHIYIGADEEATVLSGGVLVPLKKVWIHNISDIEIVLDILYNRYGFYEQFECFIRHTTKYRKTKATEILASYKELDKMLNTMDFEEDFDEEESGILF